MADSKKRNVISSLAGGRNGYSPPWEIADNECADAVNVDFYGTPFARKRGGFVTPALTGSTLAGIESSLARHVPSTDSTLAELWTTDDSGTPIINRLAGGTAWTAPTLKDAPTGNGWDFSYASINGKLMMAYKSGQPRLHLWDGSTVRRAGIAAGGVPSAADTGSGPPIAFDATATGGGTGTSLTFAHTVSATANPVLFVHILDQGLLTGVTYNGVAMTQALTQPVTGGVTTFVREYVYFLNAPTVGTHNVVISASGSEGINAQSISYTGCSSSGNSSAEQASSGSFTAMTLTTTTIAGGESLIGFTWQDTATTVSAGANTVLRSQTGSVLCAIDRLTPIYPPGPSSMATQWPVAASNMAWMIFSFLPSTTGYQSVKRYYRNRFTRQVAGITVGRSEPSSIVSFTPSGTGGAARVTQGTPPNEGETHWEVEASIDGVTFYRIATVAIGTTTYDDAAATTTYGANPLSSLTGFYSLLPAAKFIAADQGRLLTFGSYTATDKQNDIIVSAVIGSSNISDEERVDTTTNYRIGLDENDSGVPTGLIGPVQSTYIAFKDRQTWLLTATGLTSQPYNAVAESKTVGAVGPTAMDKGEDSNGNSCVYWMSHRGPYRWGLGGLEYIGRNMEDYILPGGNSVTQINLQATHVTSVVRYFPDKRQVWFWVATGSSNDPNNLFIFDVVTSGWSRVPNQDKLANVRCAVMFSNTIGASMSLDQKPYIGLSQSNASLRKADSGTDDSGTKFQAYVITKAVEPGGQGSVGEAATSQLLAKTASGVTISKTTIGDFGRQTKPPATVKLDAEGAETRVLKDFLEDDLSNLKFVQFQIGDGVAVSNAWSLERLITPMGQHGSATK